MVSPGGIVIGIDHIPELCAASLRNLQHQAPHLLADGTITILTADGREGYPPESPYDVIHVGAALHQSVDPFTQQLKPGGALFIPKGTHTGAQEVRLYTRDEEGKVHRERLMGVQYVPLTSAEYQRTRGL